MHYKYQAHIHCCLSYNFGSIFDKFSKPVVLYRGKNAVYNFIKTIIEEFYYFKNVTIKAL